MLHPFPKMVPYLKLYPLPSSPPCNGHISTAATELILQVTNEKPLLIANYPGMDFCNFSRSFGLGCDTWLLIMEFICRSSLQMLQS